MMVSGWVIVRGDFILDNNWQVWLIALVTLLFVWKTQVHILWLLGGGALIGATGILGKF